MLAIIGNGKFYSSGNDLKSMMSGVSDTPTEILAQRAYDNHISFVDAFIDFPKPIAAMVNGPAIGIGEWKIFFSLKIPSKIGKICFSEGSKKLSVRVTLSKLGRMSVERT